MYGSSGLNWRSVQADFNDANSAMRNSGDNISQAGTVFGQLRKTILDEEQKAIDNSHREQLFNENVRQFGLTDALNKDKLLEQNRSNIVNEGLKSRELTETSKYRQAELGLRGQALAESRRNNNLLNQERSIKVGAIKDADNIRQYGLMYTAGIGSNDDARSESVSTLTRVVNDPKSSITDKNRAQTVLDHIDSYNKNPDKSNFDKNASINTLYGQLGDSSALKSAADSEKALTDTRIAADKALTEKRSKAFSDVNSRMTELGYDDNTVQGLSASLGVMTKLLSGTKHEIDPNAIVNDINVGLGRRTNWTNDKYTLGGNFTSHSNGNVLLDKDVARVVIDSLASGKGTLNKKPVSDDVLKKLRKELGVDE